MRALSWRTRSALAAALFVAGCGDRAANFPTPAAAPPTAPAGLAAGSVVTVVRGDTGLPVEGATVTIAGRAYVSDTAGSVRIDEAATPGALVDVTAAPVLDRQTRVGRGPLGTLALWPRSTPAGIDEAFTATLVYTRDALSGAGATGEEPLRRIATGAAPLIVPSAEILADEFAHAALIQSVARINAAARGTVTYALAPEAPATALVFQARIGIGDPSCGDRTLAFTRTTQRAGDIIRGEIIYCSREATHRAALVVHELGHTFGFNHSLDPRDMMFSTFTAGHAVDFRAREAEVMSLVMLRPPGNRYPDSDRDVTAAAVSEQVIVCR
jgi:hypothetical protein